jgi:hypothetical protein
MSRTGIKLKPRRDDLGVQFARALEKLPQSGGTIKLPAGVHRFQTPLDFGSRCCVRLEGTGYYCRENWLPAATELIYEGQGDAIVIGDGVHDSGGIHLRDFGLRYPELDASAIRVRGRNADGIMERLRLVGPSAQPEVSKGIVIDYVGSNYHWRLTSVHCERFHTSLELCGGAHNTSLYHCSFFRNVYGPRIGTQGLCRGVGFYGCDTQLSLIGLDLLNVHGLLWEGLYTEALGRGPDSRIIRLGHDGTTPVSVSILHTAFSTGAPIIAPDRAEHAISIERAVDLTIEGNVFSDGFAHSAVENLGNYVKGVRLKSNRRGSNRLIDDYTGVDEVSEQGRSDFFCKTIQHDPSPAAGQD